MVGQDVTDDTEAVATMCGPHDALLNAEHVESALLDPLHTDERVASPANPGGIHETLFCDGRCTRGQP